MNTSLEQADQKVVFGLDIGTRSVVGTVGYMNNGQFNVIAQTVEKHQTRAMLDGQIHDIGKVGATIRIHMSMSIRNHMTLRMKIYITLILLRFSRLIRSSFRKILRTLSFIL